MSAYSVSIRTGNTADGYKNWRADPSVTLPSNVISPQALPFLTRSDIEPVLLFPEHPRELIRYVLDGLVEVHHICLAWGYTKNSFWLTLPKNSFERWESWVSGYKQYFDRLINVLEATHGDYASRMRNSFGREFMDGILRWIKRLSGSLDRMSELKEGNTYRFANDNITTELNSDEKQDLKDVIDRARFSTTVLTHAAKAKEELQGLSGMQYLANYEWDWGFINYIRGAFWTQTCELFIVPAQLRFSEGRKLEEWLGQAMDNVWLAQKILAWIVDVKDKALRERLWRRLRKYEDTACSSLESAVEYTGDHADPARQPVTSPQPPELGGSSQGTFRSHSRSSRASRNGKLDTSDRPQEEPERQRYPSHGKEGAGESADDNSQRQSTGNSQRPSMGSSTGHSLLSRPLSSSSANLPPPPPPPMRSPRELQDDGY